MKKIGSLFLIFILLTSTIYPVFTETVIGSEDLNIEEPIKEGLKDLEETTTSSSIEIEKLKSEELDSQKYLENIFGDISIKYIDEENNVIDSETLNFLELTDHTIQAKEFEGYTLNDEESKTITLTKEEPMQEVIFKYIQILHDGFGFDKDTGTITTYKGSSRNIVIPDVIDGVEVHHIGDYAINYQHFEYLKGLENVILPKNLITIGHAAFAGNNLTEISIPDSVTSIGGSAFSGNKLTEVIIPDSVTSIGDYAFYDNNLTVIKLPANTDLPLTIGRGAFSKNYLHEVFGYGIAFEGQTNPIAISGSSLDDIFVTNNSLPSVLGWVEDITNECFFTIETYSVEKYKISAMWRGWEVYTLIPRPSLLINYIDEDTYESLAIDMLNDPILGKDTFSISNLLSADPYLFEKVYEGTGDPKLGEHTITIDKKFEGYKLNDIDTKIITLTSSNPRQEVQFKYKKIIDYSILVKAIDEEGNMLNSKLLDGLTPESYVIPAEVIFNDIEGYALNDEETKTVTLTKEEPEQEITFKYKKLELEPEIEGIIITKHTDEESNIIDEETLTGLDLGEHIVQAKKIEGYVLIDDKEKTVRLTKDNPKQEVEFKYRKESLEPEATIIVKYINLLSPIGENNVLDTDIYPNLQLDKYNITAKDIKGYKLVDEKIKNVELKNDGEIVTVEFMYKKIEDPKPDSKPDPKPEPKPDPKPEIDDLPEGIFISRWLDHRPIIDKPFKIEKETIIKYVLSNEQKEILKEHRLVPRLYYWHEEKEKWVALGTKFKDGKIETYKKYKGWMAVFGVKQPDFKDIKGNEWYVERVDRVNGLAIIEGYTDETFKANNSIDRKEFYAMVGRIFGAVPKGQTSLYNEFDYIIEGKGSNWYIPYLEEFKNKGIIYEIFNEEQAREEITRLEVVEVLTRMLERVEEVEYINLDIFKDTQSLKDIKIAKIIDGYEDKTLRLNNKITRLETIILILNTLENLGW